MKTEASNVTALPTVFYLTTLDTYVRRRLKAYKAYFSSSAIPLVDLAGTPELDNAVLDIAEALIIGDGVALKVTGENTALVLLVRAFGIQTTIELIRHGAIRFIEERNEALFTTSGLMKFADGTPVPPGNPAVATIDYFSMEPALTSGSYSDGETLAQLALSRYKTYLNLDRADIRDLSRRARSKTQSVPPRRLSEITSRVGNAYATGELTPFGLSPQIARDTNEYQDRAYVNLISRLAHTETLLDFDLDQYQMPDRWADMLAFTAQVTSGNEVLRSVDDIMELRGVADIRSLFRDGAFKLQDIIRIREHSATRAFRSWLWSKPDPRDGVALSRAFIEEVSGTRVDRARDLWRMVRTASLTLVQDAVLDHIPGIAPPVRWGVDAAVALVSDKAIERLRRKSPSAFFDQVVDPAKQQNK